MKNLTLSLLLFLAAFAFSCGSEEQKDSSDNQTSAKDTSTVSGAENEMEYDKKGAEYWPAPEWDLSPGFGDAGPQLEAVDYGYSYYENKTAFPELVIVRFSIDSVDVQDPGGKAQTYLDKVKQELMEEVNKGSNSHHPVAIVSADQIQMYIYTDNSKAVQRGIEKYQWDDAQLQSTKVVKDSTWREVSQWVK